MFPIKVHKSPKITKPGKYKTTITAKKKTKMSKLSSHNDYDDELTRCHARCFETGRPIAAQWPSGHPVGPAAAVEAVVVGIAGPWLRYCSGQHW